MLEQKLKSRAPIIALELPILVEWGNCYVGQLGQNESYSKEPNHVSFYFLKPNQNFLAFIGYAQCQVV